MRKIIFSINVTIDGIADHTNVIADDELHDFYTNLLKKSDVILMGRKTYQLMESFWPVAYKDSGSTLSMIRFADTINPMNKIIFSNTLTEVNWENSRLADKNLREVISDFKNQSGKNVSVGSLTLASQLLKLNLIDEFWFVVQPILAGSGKNLFEGINEKRIFKLADTKIFKSGVVALRYLKNN